MKRVRLGVRVGLGACVVACLGACAPSRQGTDGADAPGTPTPTAEVPPGPVEFFPGVWAVLETGVVEFEAEVAIDCHQPETPDVYLEVVCCTPDTREHESLLVTRVAPSSVHAALLLVGAEPGRPGRWRVEEGHVEPVEPAGPRVEVTFLLGEGSGEAREVDPAAWVVHGPSGRTLREIDPGTGWVFAGSRVREFGGREVYDADGTGQLIGLHTFGSETIAWTTPEHPDSGVQTPQWLARNEAVPPIGTPVRVRLRVVEER